MDIDGGWCVLDCWNSCCEGYDGFWVLVARRNEVPYNIASSKRNNARSFKGEY